MREVPPQIEPDFALDAVRVTLLRPPDLVHSPLLKVLFLFPFFAMGAMGMYQRSVPAVFMAVVAGTIVHEAFKFVRARSPRDVELTIRRGRLQLGDAVHDIGGIRAARWDCTPPTTRLVLVAKDGTETVLEPVMRRGQDNPGITRKQREWIAALVTDQLDEASAADIPEGLRRLTQEHE